MHATLLDSIPLIYERVVAPLSAWERDAYCAEAADVAVDLGARSEDVPRNQTALTVYLNRVYTSGAIAVSSQARELADAVLSPPFAAVVGPVAAVNRLVTIGLLPEYIRAQYGFSWTERRERWLKKTFGSLRLMRKTLPRRAALWADAL